MGDFKFPATVRLTAGFHTGAAVAELCINAEKRQLYEMHAVPSYII
jgi:hypothetical protein